MEVFILLLAFLGYVSSQVSPVWIESPYVETKDVLLIDNNLETFGDYYWVSTYTKALNNPQVLIAINDLNVVSDTEQLGFWNTISFNRGTTGFTHVLYIFSPT